MALADIGQGLDSKPESVVGWVTIIINMLENAKPEERTRVLRTVRSYYDIDVEDL